jgi:hypothetical protein
LDMRRVGLVLAISAVALALIPGPATAQTEEPTLGCIPTSDTPFQVGLVGGLPFATAIILATPEPFPMIVAFGDVTPEGNAFFPSGIAPGTYDVVFIGRFGFIHTLGTVQIGNCSPTSKEQCKNGGWRNFPQFTNEGQCIKFVNHGP